MTEDYPEHDQRVAVCFRQWDDAHKSASGSIERKAFIGLELKKDKPGAFTARIATLNVIDKDGDVTLPGAFPQGKTILISAYMHGSWMGALPVGKGIIKESGNDVLFEGEFNLSTAAGKEHYEAIKFAPDLQEWSYGFIATEKEEDTEFQDNHVWRILKKVDVFEVSPVLRGAGMNTATLAIKSLQSESKGALPYKDLGKAPEDEAWDAGKEVAAASVADLKLICAWVDSADSENKTAYKLPHHKASGKHVAVWKGVSAAMAAVLGARGGVDIPEADRKAVYNHLSRHYQDFEKEVPAYKANYHGLTLADQAEAALAAVEGVVARVKALGALRREEGKEAMSDSTHDRMMRIMSQMGQMMHDMQEMVDEMAPSDDGKAAYIEALKILTLTEVNR